VTGLQTAFIAVGAIGFLLLMVSLLLGEFGDHDVELGHDTGLGHDTETPHTTETGTRGSGGLEAPDLRKGPVGGALYAPSRWSMRVLAASAVGFGAAGFTAAALGLPPALSWSAAIAGFLAVGSATYSWILKPLARQQYNSLLSRYSHVGRDAVVTLEILPGGWGQVTFRDRQGARVTQTARSDLPEAVRTGAAVKIVDVFDGGVVVHRNTLAD
jgi:membrane protein implicated in regulation of membrane protease activity